MQVKNKDNERVRPEAHDFVINIGNDAERAGERAVVKTWLMFSGEEATRKKNVKTPDAAPMQKTDCYHHATPRHAAPLSCWYLQRIKTLWSSCNHAAGNIGLNTELVKKPKDLLEYVVVHEMAHLLQPTHSERFAALLDLHDPTWKEARAELNALPLASLVQTQG